METQTPFRIGGVYRQQDGTVVRLLDRTSDFPVGAGIGHARHVDGGEMRSGFRRLSDGVDTINFKGGECNLLPGELHQINGEWVPRGVPVEDKPAKSELPELVKHFLQRESTPQPTKERARPALDWNKPTPFDAFGGFFSEPADMADWQDTYYPR
jgi:hypothetical protein